MPELVPLYLGSPNDLNHPEEFERARFVDAEPTRAPANLPKHYDVRVTVESRDSGEKYTVELNSRTINNWLTRFEPVLREELEGDDGMDGEYRGKERNAVIVEILMNTVSAWVNPNKATLAK